MACARCKPRPAVSFAPTPSAATMATQLNTQFRTIEGPPYSGPRKTRINLMEPDSWPCWIVRDRAGNPVDLGDICGPLRLADITTQAKSLWWLWLILAALVVIGLARGGGALSWR